MKWLSGRAREPARPKSDRPMAPTAPRDPLPAELCTLKHDDPLPDGLVGWLEVELEADAIAAGGIAPVVDLPMLRARQDGMPDWWMAGNNIVLAGPEAGPVVPELSFFPGLPTNCIAILGANAKVHRLVYMADGARTVVGNAVNMWGMTLGAIGPSTIMIGERTTATFDGSLDARNGGSIIIGADGMWGAGIRIITDDMHAIRDRDTGERINGRGGRIAVESKVWLAEQVRIVGSCRVGEGSVVGMGSLVTGCDLPGHSICVGRPARPVRSNIVWSREDDR